MKILLALLVTTSIISPAMAEGNDAYNGLFDNSFVRSSPSGTSSAPPISSGSSVGTVINPQPQQSQTQPQQDPIPVMGNANNGTLSPSGPKASWSNPTGEATVGNTLWGSGSSTANGRSLVTGSSDGYCDPEVAKIDEKLKAQEIESRTSLARSTFSLLPSGFGHLSCIDTILNSTINIFGQEGVEALIAQVLNSFSCDIVLRQVNSYANQEISEYTSLAVGMAMSKVGDLTSKLPIGNVIPGVNIGSMASSSVNLHPSVNIGGVGSNGSDYTNLSKLWGSSGSSGSTYSGPQLPSKLFGR